MIAMVGDINDIIITSCLVSCALLEADKTTKLKYYAIRECHLLIHLTV